MSFDFFQGETLLIDKPLDWTSFDVVNKIRGLIQRKYKRKCKVGHAGTLDPKATGLLILCTGKKTKTIDQIQAQEKGYAGEFYLGATTPTFDTESAPDATFPTEHLTLPVLQEATANFMGEIAQLPPMHSAIRKDGKRLYEHARKGETIEREARMVQVHEFTISHYQSNLASFFVRCGKGTYIRSLAHDFGKVVGSGAYLASLRRTQIGDYHVNDALEIDTFEALIAQLDPKVPSA